MASNDWKISTGYYSLYFSLYAVLMKIGIKSENHTCTIALLQHLPGNFFTPDECEMLEKARQARTETQYYVATLQMPMLGTLARQVLHFLVKCREIVEGLKEKDDQALRHSFAGLIEESRCQR